MKHVLSLLAICLMAFGLGCTTDANPNPSSSSSSSDDNVTAKTETPETAPLSSDTRLVSLSLPNMTCSGCAASVRDALTKIDGVTDIELDVAANTGSFKTSNPDIETLLATASEDRAPLKDFAIAE